MLEFRFDTQLLIEGHGLDEDAIHDYIQQNICAGLGDIHDVVIENMERQENGLHG